MIGNTNKTFDVHCVCILSMQNVCLIYGYVCAYHSTLDAIFRQVLMPYVHTALPKYSIYLYNGTFFGHSFKLPIQRKPPKVFNCRTVFTLGPARVVKGGSDTATKLMDDCLVRIPKHHMNTESVATSRCFMILMVLNHRLMQIFTALDDLNYPSLKHYREAASQRLTFHSSLLASANHFKN